MIEEEWADRLDRLEAKGMQRDTSEDGLYECLTGLGVAIMLRTARAAIARELAEKSVSVEDVRMVAEYLNDRATVDDPAAVIVDAMRRADIREVVVDIEKARRNGRGPNTHLNGVRL